MDTNGKILQQYHQLLKTYVDMRHQIATLLGVMEEEQVPTRTATEQAASDLLELAYEYMDEASGRLEDVDAPMTPVRSLLFGYGRLSGEMPEASDSLEEALCNLLNSLGVNSRGTANFDH